LLAIVTIPPLLMRSFALPTKIQNRSKKNRSPLWRCAPVWQMIEIPGDLAIDRACGAGRAQRIINLNN
jgi:hypothetical protein